jgi:N-acetylmuramoyl-L-alanine amidase
MTNSYKVIEKLLTFNQYSRPGKEVWIGENGEKHVVKQPIKGIVVHWVANRNSTALANRNFFENRKYGKTGYGSAHEIIGLDGNVIKCLPDDELSYNVGSPEPYTDDALKYLSDYPNDCTYGIECTHIGYDGEMTAETYNTLVERCFFLMKKFNLVGTPRPLWLHQEVVGWKDCHRWFIYNPEEWVKFKALVYGRCEILENLVLEHEWQWEMLEVAFADMKKEGVLKDDSWQKKAENKTLSSHELAWLNTIIMKRMIKKEF